jgi:hypothetical protein
MLSEGKIAKKLAEEMTKTRKQVMNFREKKEEEKYEKRLNELKKAAKTSPKRYFEQALRNSRQR